MVVGKRNGRPRQKGAKPPSPEVTVAQAPRTALNVPWYGGGRREVEVISATGQWYKSGEGLVPVCWAFVHDCTGTHRDDYFFSTDPEMTPGAVSERITGRWSIETTFQEMRPSLGLETTRGRTEATALRLVPCLFGLFSAVALRYDLRPKRTTFTAVVDWPGKVETTFSDAITAIRSWLWVDWVFAHHEFSGAFSKLPPLFQEALLSALAPTA